jgi:hypothetical protein
MDKVNVFLLYPFFMFSHYGFSTANRLGMQFTIFSLEQNGQTLHLLTPLQQEQLPKQAKSRLFAGCLKDPLRGPMPANVDVNVDFMVVLHEVIRDVMVNDSDVIEDAATQTNGYVFIVDRRAPEGNEVDKTDIIGIFLVNDYKTDTSRYRPNPDYLLVSEHGVASLPEQVEVELIRRLMLE